MTTAEVIVTLAGLATIAWIVWYFWIFRKEGVTVTEIAGVQRAAITVKGGYDPDTIVVRLGKPVRLDFTRRESSLCSEMVLFDGIGKSAQLPENETVTIEFTPDKAGEIPFQCQMGMLRGRVIVTT